MKTLFNNPYITNPKKEYKRYHIYFESIYDGPTSVALVKYYHTKIGAWIGAYLQQEFFSYGGSQHLYDTRYDTLPKVKTVIDDSPGLIESFTTWLD